MVVQLYGMLAEAVGTARVELEVHSTHQLRQELVGRYPALDGLSYSLAVDRVLVHHDMPLTGKEEIAALPPFAGG